MMICYSPITTCSRNAINIKRHLSTHLYGVVTQGSYKFSCHSLLSGLSRRHYTGFRVSVSNRRSSWHDKRLLINQSTVGPKEKLEVSFLSPDAKMKCSKIESNMRNLYWYSRFAYTGVIVSLLVCYSSTSQSAYADASRDKDANNVHNHSSHDKFHNGKRVYTDYSIIGIPGDGRCLFRSVAHGFCLRSGKLAPGEKMQRELADELRTRVSIWLRVFIIYTLLPKIKITVFSNSTKPKS
ncbi:OTU domain [Arabidopsis thaliana x Arabidopsis arenosa]|uniref:OTU domain n=1 Tax=Arabidopsis thaliana x Arabidopsis arenosa TaxID=1240361 RepID=A0A8T1ZRJ5_9BRAS|nr:OTU domain [Arabidopsis thaliana x Arabidopsis arenosa]KAG7561257.1 OTU domain [Arabidopsis thaliana x Arabidopsis arenosa]